VHGIIFVRPGQRVIELCPFYVTNCFLISCDKAGYGVGILTSQSVIALVFTASCSIIEFSVYTICTSLLNRHFNSVDELCSKTLIYYIYYYNVVRRSGEWIPDPDSLPFTETINWDLNIGHEKEKTRFLDNLSLLRKLSQIHLTSMLLDGIVLI